ncbi:hypothetical protein KSF_008270 [Reticulibacter mediterranei]|uniref:Uncharacterized protein n=1 Tax=Reticulibacter mediterranei TaxID=2778369 RepID=A0A8J3I8F8_9CHLR|nr:hypothetical protein [Reticulibacter mediterranei]GHO90779.1 hypothetical protein KSF_008270 [Reticulibacter mediterranei]
MSGISLLARLSSSDRTLFVAVLVNYLILMVGYAGKQATNTKQPKAAEFAD